jgi:predicted phosphodiesterase
MTTRSRETFASDDEYLRAVEALELRLAADAGSRELVRSLEQVFRFEHARGIADDETLLGRLLGLRGLKWRRTALISDIHGNLAGLAAVLADIERCGCDRVLCLGDLVEGGDDDDGVVAELRRRGIRSVRGNHDENHDVKLRTETREFLALLPESIVEGDTIYTHISPRARKRKVNHVVEAWNAFEDADFRIAFVGHAHVPLVFRHRGDRHGEASEVAFTYNQPLPLDPGERYLVCVGSVGYGRDDVGKLRYAIHDRDRQTLELRAVEGPLLQMDHSLRITSSGPFSLAPLS